LSQKKILKWNKKSRLIGIIASLIASVGIYITLVEMEKNALRVYERERVYVATAEIPKGTMITGQNASSFMKAAEVEKGMVPGNALRDITQLDRLAASYSISEGTLLMTDMFEEFQEITAGMKEPVIVGFKAEDLYQVVGGVLRQGDRIHIYTVSENGLASLNWRDIYVQQVFDHSGNPVEAADPAISSPRINIYLDAENVEQFYSELALGSLRVVKVCE